MEENEKDHGNSYVANKGLRGLYCRDAPITK